MHACISYRGMETKLSRPAELPAALMVHSPAG